MEACLRALPDGALDLAGCGEAIAVRACAGVVGTFVDDVAFAEGMAIADARLADPAGFAADVSAVVGADRVDEYGFVAREIAQGALERQFGRWYLDEAARAAAIAAAVESAIDTAYARPLDYLEPHAVAPGDLARTRHVAADYLLAHLASLDLAATEFGRPLELLTREYRAQHVADLRHFREAAELEGNFFIGRWLGAYVEIEIDPVTGAVTGILFEID
jgi:hypothetical protein